MPARQIRRFTARIATLTVLPAVLLAILTLRPAVPRQLVLDLAPVDLAAGDSHVDVAQPAALATTMEQTGWIRGFEVVLTDADGRTVPMDVVHHVKLHAPDRRDLFGPAARIIAAAGSETAPVLLPRIVGYRVQQGDSLLLTAMLHNPTQRSWSGVSVRFRLFYAPAGAWPPPLAVQPFFLHVTAPGAPAHYDLPPGRSERSWIARPAVGGRVLAVGGHIHAHGSRLRFEDLTTGRVIWDEAITLAPAGGVLRVPRTFFFARGGVRIHRDHTYKVTAVYHNPTGDTLRAAGMGTVAGIFRPEEGAAWPALDRTDPVYLAQVAETRQAHRPGINRGPEHAH